MTRSELLNRLKEAGVPHDRYTLEGGLHDNRLCLECKNNRWYVYYCENGERTRVQVFLLEVLAYEHFYHELISLIALDLHGKIHSG